MTDIQEDDVTKASSKTTDDTKATSSADDAKSTDTTDETTQATQEPAQDVSGHTDDEIAEAFEDNPDAPEEAIDQKYLVGGEVPVSAPGTEGLPRE